MVFYRRLPCGRQFLGIGRRDLQQAAVDLFLGLCQSGQRVDAQEQRPGFVVVDIENPHVDFHVGVQVAAQVAVEQLQPANSCGARE
jgi:hypothetical protein